MAAQTSATPTGLCVTNTTTEKVALCSADLGMMPLATSPAGREGRRCATLAGKDSTAPTQSVCQGVMTNMDIVTNQGNASAELAGKAATAMSASDTQAVSMAPASNPGSVTAKKAGGAFSATRVRPSFMIVRSPQSSPMPTGNIDSSCI